MVDAVAQAYGETPAQVLADTGYCNEISRNWKSETDGYVGPGGQGRPHG